MGVCAFGGDRRLLAAVPLSRRMGGILVSSWGGFCVGEVCLRTEAGISPRQATYFLACQKVSKEHSPIVCVPSLRFTSLRANLRHAIQPAVRQNSLRAGALRSNTLPQVRSRSIGTLRCQCPQPEPRAVGAARRANAGGLQELWRNWLQA